LPSSSAREARPPRRLQARQRHQLHAIYACGCTQSAVARSIGLATRHLLLVKCGRRVVCRRGSGISWTRPTRAHSLSIAPPPSSAGEERPPYNPAGPTWRRENLKAVEKKLSIAN